MGEGAEPSGTEEANQPAGMRAAWELVTARVPPAVASMVSAPGRPGTTSIPVSAVPGASPSDKTWRPPAPDQSNGGQVTAVLDVRQRRRDHLADVARRQLAGDPAPRAHEGPQRLPRRRACRVVLGRADHERGDVEIDPRDLPERVIEGRPVLAFR